jgi:hypothetical protein
MAAQILKLDFKKAGQLVTIDDVSFLGVSVDGPSEAFPWPVEMV